jgi:protease IV
MRIYVIIHRNHFTSTRKWRAVRAVASRTAPWHSFRYPSGASMFCVPAALLAGAPALAQEASVERPLVPGLSTAGDDGPMALWRNPANLAFDPDPGLAILYGQDVGTNASQFAAVSNGGPLGLGVTYTTDPETNDWWTVSSGLALRLGRDVSVGTHLGWQIPSGADNNFTTWDLGVGYRPLPWLGVAGIAQNLGGPSAQVLDRYGGGVVLRPVGDAVMLGVDYSIAAPGKVDPEDGGLVEGTLRVEPTSGLVIRGYANQEGTIGGGLEIYFGGTGVGAQARASVEESGEGNVIGYLQTAPPDRTIIHTGKKVPEFVIAQPFPYQPSGGFLGSRGESYLHLLGRLERAAEDPAVKGLVLHLDATPFSYAQVEELRGVLEGARQRGKPIVAYLDRASSSAAYLLACSADKIFVHPAGGLELIGISAELQFFRGTLDLVGVKPQVVRRAEFKSAMEGFTNAESSDENREQMNALLDDLSGYLVKSIATSRGKSEDEVWELIDGAPYTPQEAVDKGLADGIAYPQDLEEHYKGIFAGGYNLDESYRVADDTEGWRGPRELAVIYVAGEIVAGMSRPPGLFGGGNATGSDSIVAAIEAARRDPAVKGVLLRVDSPGGSAFGSDEIWREIERLKEDKPIVVSMGGLAASGGYWVSMNATAIYAESTTITGSIGVISGKFSLEDLYDKIGLKYEVYNRGRNAAMYSLSKPWDDVEMAAVDRMVGETYKSFKKKVGEGRSMDESTVDTVARGRVWSGAAGKARGLVDEIGGFPQALERLKKEAGISPKAKVDVISYDSRGGSAVARQTVGTVRSVLFPRLDDEQILPPELAILQEWRLLQDDPILAVLPYQLVVR